MLFRDTWGSTGFGQKVERRSEGELYWGLYGKGKAGQSKQLKTG